MVAALVLVRRDGIGLDRFVWAAIRHARAPKRLVDAPDPDLGTPAWGERAGDDPPPAALRLPARGITADGVIDLGGDGAALIVECSTVSFALRTVDEQEALAGAFARWLNTLTGPTQILARAERVTLAGQIAALRDAAPALPHPALERAALDHAAYLTELDASRDLLWRQVLLVIREPGTDLEAAAARVWRRAQETVRRLAAAAITARVLDAAAATSVLASAADPSAPALPGGIAAPDQIIHGASS